MIVYCMTKRETEAVADFLRRTAKVDAECYHAGLGAAQRRSVHRRFVRDQLRCVVATIAFGMGIDKPDGAYIVSWIFAPPPPLPSPKCCFGRDRLW